MFHQNNQNPIEDSSQNYVVQKFGGTSVGSAVAIAQLKNAVINQFDTNPNVLVVVSAFSKITDSLLRALEYSGSKNMEYLDLYTTIAQRHIISFDELTVDTQTRSWVMQDLADLKIALDSIYAFGNYDDAMSDYIVSFGERMSSKIVASYINVNSDQKFVCKWLDARDLIFTNDHFGSAKVDFGATNQNISQFFDNNYLTNSPIIYVVTGFIGSYINTSNANHSKQQTTTLGRGGSDYSASIFGSALYAQKVEIWTDVNGVMTTDPRKVKKAFSQLQLSFVEAAEMAHFGAKVLYTPTVAPCKNKNIPLVIRNTFDQNFEGTVISNDAKFGYKYPISGVSTLKNITVLTIQGSAMTGVAGFSTRFFECFAKNNISLIMITQSSSEHSISVVIESSRSVFAKKIVDKEFLEYIKSGDIEPIVIDNDSILITIIGGEILETPNIGGKFFSSLGKNGINISAIATTGTEISISAIIPAVDELKALNVVHEEMFGNNQKNLNIYIVGTGLIGKALLSQITENTNFIQIQKNINLNVKGLCNTTKMLFCDDDKDTLSLNSDWSMETNDQKTNLENANLDTFVNKILAQKLNNSIVVDCTSTDMLGQYYQKLVEGGVSVVTPNKKVASGDYGYFKSVKESAMHSGAKYIYETNVGAALPVISTLKNLVETGDQVLKVEAVLSGTLSYIFNTFGTQVSFSSVVKTAKELGFTEPDPREDLNGLDVARKILILARECGFTKELDDITIQSLLTPIQEKVETIEDFWQELSNNDKAMADLLAQATSKNQRLLYIASLDNTGKIQVGLRSVDSSHPFYGLSGSDNIVSFWTRRYGKNPLVIKGSGAGAEVTASGILGDILQCGV